MKRTWTFGMAVLLGIMLLTGCSGSAKEMEKLQADNSALQEQVDVLTGQLTALEDKLATVTSERDVYEQQLLRLGFVPGEDPDTPVPGEDEETLPVFGSNEEGVTSQISTVVVKTDEPLLTKMNLLGAELSAKFFGGLPMEATKINTVEGKEILIVNLKETDTGKTWTYDYFQGSTGGLETIMALSETFLQREYGGRWVDGVQFLLNGEPIEFEHVEALSEIFYR